jgi:hypothetical protein
MNSFLRDLQDLQIVPSKGKFRKNKNQLKILNAMCIAHLANIAHKSFDPTTLVDENGRIPIQFPVIPEEDESDCEIPKEIQGETPKIIAWIPARFPDESESVLSEFADVSNDDNDCQQIVNNLDNKIQMLNLIISSMCGMTIAFGKTLQSVANSGKFADDVVQTFLFEVSIFLETLLSPLDEIEGLLLDDWHFFYQIAIVQQQLFGLYMDDRDNREIATILLWTILNKTSEQRDCLQRCIQVSDGNEDIMQNFEFAFKSMLDTQETFILKLIARLNASKNKQGTFSLQELEC